LVSSSSSLNTFPGAASLHHVALSALDRPGPVLPVTADTLLVEGIRAFGHLVVAFLHWVAFGAGAGLIIFIGV